MFTQIGKIFLLSCAVVGIIPVAAVQADDSVGSKFEIPSNVGNNPAFDYSLNNEATVSPSANSSTPQSREELAKAISQLRSIQQLRDVDPTNWSYEALRSLVEQYGCIVGYPDQTYRGDRALTRYEFAAGLNACIQALERRILEAQTAQTPFQDNLTPITEIKPVAYEDSFEQFADMANRAFFNRTGTFQDIFGFWGQANAWLGWRNFPGSFLENDIARDARTLSIIIQNGKQQQAPQPYLRTLDLSNPFNTSVMQNPSYLRDAQPGQSPNGSLNRPNLVYP